MKKRTCLLLSVLCILAVQLNSVCAAAGNPTPEELIAAHLKALGVVSGSAAAQIKSIIFTGQADVEFIQGMQGKMNGPVTLVSQGNKMVISMKFSDINYPGERFAYDGKSVNVGTIQPPGVKSPIADFIFRYNKIMKNGLLGGVFSNAWPLLDIKRGKPSFMEVRRTKVEGKELYELEYRPKDRHGDMKIRMFFDPETYRHVRTEYKVTTKDDVSTNLPGRNLDPDENLWAISAQASGEAYYILTEKFGDFRQVAALTLPHSYEIDYDIAGTAQYGFVGKWKIEVQNVGCNVPNLSPELFNAQK